MQLKLAEIEVTLLCITGLDYEIVNQCIQASKHHRIKPHPHAYSQRSDTPHTATMQHIIYIRRMAESYYFHLTRNISLNAVQTNNCCMEFFM